MQEVVRLDERVVQLDERKTAFLKSFPIRTVLHQLIDGEVSADIAQELDPLQVQQPVGVVDHERAAARKIQVAAEMLTDASQIALDLVDGEHRSLRGAVGRVTDHARAAADHGNRSMTQLLHVRQGHDAHQVPGVQTGRGRIEALVQGDTAAVEGTPQRVFVRHLGDEAAGTQHVEHIGPRHGHILGRN